MLWSRGSAELDTSTVPSRSGIANGVALDRLAEELVKTILRLTDVSTGLQNPVQGAPRPVGTAFERFVN